MSKDFLTATEAADYLGIALSYLYKLTSSNAIAFYRPCGRKILFKVDDLRTWIEGTRVKSNAEIQAEISATKK
ncbi:MAG: excisionase family DNA-binding protein [Bacteroidaceae bacterium]|nr:excisionase family DNA-binding protein [Bacteroidaceae bacterium]